VATDRITGILQKMEKMESVKEKTYIFDTKMVEFE
jgi:hypothetical protein